MLIRLWSLKYEEKYTHTDPKTLKHIVAGILFLFSGALNKQLVVTWKLYDEKKLS